MEWLFLLLSIPIGVIAARIDVLISWALARIRHGKLRLSGDWAEWVPDSTGRQFSIGTIEYNLFRRRYDFSGTNYRNNGDPYCHWQTVMSHVDYDKLEFHYVFATKDVASMQTLSYGYGVLQLVSRGAVLAPEDGYYIYAQAGDQAVSVSHTLRAIATRPKNRNENAAALLREIFPEHTDAVG